MSRGREPLPTHVWDTRPLPATYDQALDRGLAQLQIDLDPTARDAIAGHVRLLLAWTEAINLTAIREPAAVATGHVVDSLAAVPWLREHPVERLLDLGSGGGLPGIPIAAAIPSMHVTLVEPIAKKARFLAASTDAIGIAARTTVVTARAETIGRDPLQRGRWHAVTARAVATLADLIELAFPLLRPTGSLIAWKRGDIDDELRAARRAMDALGGGSLETVEVRVDDLRDHKLVVATRLGTVPPAYPRDPAARRRRPW